MVVAQGIGEEYYKILSEQLVTYSEVYPEHKSRKCYCYTNLCSKVGRRISGQDDKLHQ
jgi:hypothetical protein